MKKSARWAAAIALVVAASLALSLFGPAAPAANGQQEIPDDVQALLKEVAQAYAGMTTYSGSIEITMAQAMPSKGIDSKFTSSVRVLMARPNKLRLEADLHEQHVVLTTDGSSLWHYLSASGKYAKEDAAEDFEDILTGPVAPQMVMGLPRASIGLFGSDPYGVLLNEVTGAELVAGAEGATETEVLLRMDGADLRLWVDAAGKQIGRWEFVPYGLIEAFRARNPESADLSVQITGKATGTAGGEIAAAEFAFTPPEGAEEVEDVAAVFGGGEEGPGAEELVGKPAPDFTLDGLEDGQTWKLADLKGKVAAVDFWATWCGPCRMEMPKLAEIYADLKDKGFVLLAANQQETAEEVRAFLKDAGIDVPVALDKDGAVGDQYGASGLPTLVIIDRTGTVRKVHQGYAPGMENALRKEIEELLAEE